MMSSMDRSILLGYIIQDMVLLSIQGKSIANDDIDKFFKIMGSYGH